MKNKKVLIGIIAFIIVLFGAGIGIFINSNNSQNELENITISTDKKVLVLYFSYTGNTEKLANKIKDKTNADIVKIETVTPYSDDYDTVVDQGAQEQEDEFRPEIKTKVDNLDSYDTIIVGSPIWWYEIAPALKTFLENNDLSNKNVALFTTHGGYGAGRSDEEIKKYCPNSNILKSITMRGTDVDNEEKNINEWLQEILK